MSTNKADLLNQVRGYLVGTKAAIEALTGSLEGFLAYATDTKELGSYDGSAWTWRGTTTFDIHALTEKTTIADNDEFPGADSESSYDNKKFMALTLSNYVFSQMLLKPEESINGGFDTDADGWTLGSGWSWNAGGYVEHSSGTADLSFAGELIIGSWYLLELEVGGTTGSVDVGLGGPAETVAAGTGYFSILVKYLGGLTKVVITPTNTFDGTIDNVNVQRIPVVQDVISDGTLYGRQDENWAALGDAASKNVGTGSGDVAAGNRGVTNGDTHDHAGGDGNPVDHGGLSGLSDDDHTQYQLKSLLTTLGDIIYATASSVWARLAGNTTTTRKFLRQVGDGAASAAPTWDTLQSGDIPDISATYAIAAKGVTNGDSHDHNGGDGAQIDHVNLANKGSNTHATIDTHLASTSNPHSVTAAQASAIPTDGWEARTETWTRTGNYTFTVSGDLTAVFRKGTKAQYNDGAVEYGVVYSSSHSSGTTTVTLITNSDYAMAAATITGTFISYIENPAGFPDWFNYAPSYSGNNAMTFTPVSTEVARWRATDKTIYFVVRATGTTGGTASTQLRASLPANAASVGGNGTFVATCGDTAGDIGRGIIDITNHLAAFAKSGNVNWGLGTGRVIIGEGFYEY